MLGILVRRRAGRGYRNGERPEQQAPAQVFPRDLPTRPGLKLLYDIGHGNLATAKSMLRAQYLFSLNDELAHIHERQQRHR
ncbi:MAG: hypothetical protein R2856_26480 [Caldilineaceae bacterium]